MLFSIIWEENALINQQITIWTATSIETSETTKLIIYCFLFGHVSSFDPKNCFEK
jgi:hypothetical protein